MNEPIKSGDRCEVIAGALGIIGPNVGKQVTVGELRGEHSEHGRIWRCYGEGLVTEFGAFGTQADFAQSWLRKLPPTAAPLNSGTTGEVVKWLKPLTERPHLCSPRARRVGVGAASMVQEETRTTASQHGRSPSRQGEP